jgi:anti-sigma-K factor RskA
MDIKEYISSGIIETYVMGLCSPDEEMELEQLRSHHPELDNAIIDFEEAMEKNMLQQTTLPGDATDKRILDSLAAMKKPSAVISIHTRKRNWLKPFAVAASLLLLISAGFNYYLYRQTKNPVATNGNITLPLSDYQVLNNPAITPIAMYGVGSHSICRCTMFWDKKTGKMYVMIHHLPKSSATKDYQLWATINGKQVNIGIVQDDIRGRFIEMDNIPAGATAFSMTLEKAGGSLSPTISEIYLQGNI